MRLAYEIVTRDNKRFVYLSDVPQYLDLDDLGSWARDVRDEDPELYAEIVALFFKLSPSRYGQSPKVTRNKILG